MSYINSEPTKIEPNDVRYPCPRVFPSQMQKRLRVEKFRVAGSSTAVHEVNEERRSKIFSPILI